MAGDVLPVAMFKHFTPILSAVELFSPAKTLLKALSYITEERKLQFLSKKFLTVVGE